VGKGRRDTTEQMLQGIGSCISKYRVSGWALRDGDKNFAATFKRSTLIQSFKTKLNQCIFNARGNPAMGPPQETE
jgi:hypothetical protein